MGTYTKKGSILSILEGEIVTFWKNGQNIRFSDFHGF